MKIGFAGFMFVGRGGVKGEGGGIQKLGYNTTLESMIDKAAEMRFDGIELGDCIGPDDASRPYRLPDKEYRKKIKEGCSSRGLDIYCIAADDRFCDPTAGRPTMMMAQYRIELARDLDVDTIRIDLVASADKTTPISTQFAKAVEIIKEYTKMAEDAGITLAIHNHGWLSVANRLWICKKINSPNLKLQLDVINSVNRGEGDIFALTREAKDYLANNIHVKDQRNMFTDERDFPAEVERDKWGTGTSHLYLCNMGEGNIVDWEAYVKLLKSINYQGYLGIESFTDRHVLGIPDWESMEVGIAYLRKIGEKVGY